MQHARLSPSKGHRWVLCPASVNREAPLPDKKDTFHSAEGTIAHQLLEEVLKEKSKLVHIIKAATENKIMEQNDVKVPITQEMVDAVSVAVHYVRQIQNVEDTLLSVENSVSMGVSLDREHVDDCFGTLDIALLHKESRILEIIDYKHGKGVDVSPVNNIQLILYTLGYLRHCASGSVEKVRMTIIQPRIHGSEPIKSVDMSLEDLMQWKSYLTTAAKKTDDPKALAIPGESQCRWCKCNGRCPEQVALLIQTLFKGLTPHEDPEQIELMNNTPNLEIDDVADMLALRKFIEAYLSALEERMVDYLESGGVHQDWKMVEGRSTRIWALEDSDIVSKLQKIYKLKTDQIYKRILLGPARVEKLILAQKLQPKRLEKFRALIKKPAGKPTLALASDNRKGLPYGPTIFDDLDPELLASIEPQILKDHEVAEDAEGSEFNFLE